MKYDRSMPLGRDAPAYPRDPGCEHRRHEPCGRAASRWVGIDAPSVDLYRASGYPVHRVLESAGVVVLEGLVLPGALQGPSDLVCAAPRIIGAEGAPTRAFLRRMP